VIAERKRPCWCNVDGVEQYATFVKSLSSEMRGESRKKIMKVVHNKNTPPGIACNAIIGQRFNARSLADYLKNRASRGIWWREQLILSPGIFFSGKARSIFIRNEKITTRPLDVSDFYRRDENFNLLTTNNERFVVNGCSDTPRPILRIEIGSGWSKVPRGQRSRLHLRDYFVSCLRKYKRMKFVSWNDK